jgi:poly(3-hydroxybutyrate) depolymerase
MTQTQGTPPIQGNPPIAVGADQFAFVDPRPGVCREITVWTYRPAAYTAASPILIVMHGRNRDGRAYRDGWIAPAAARGFLVAVPEFSERFYPTSHDYNYGDMMTAQGELRARETWLFPVIDRIFESVRLRAGGTRTTYRLFGHSAGGQFVHRLMTFAYSAKIEHAVAANSGSYTLPVFDEPFPFGLGGTAIDKTELQQLFSRPLTVLLGDRDIDANHSQLPREPAAMRQGAHRFARGQFYFALAQREAACLGAPFAWRIGVAPGVAHSNPDIAPFAARLLFP